MAWTHSVPLGFCSAPTSLSPLGWGGIKMHLEVTGLFLPRMIYITLGKPEMASVGRRTFSVSEKTD